MTNDECLEFDLWKLTMESKSKGVKTCGKSSVDDRTCMNGGV